MSTCFTVSGDLALSSDGRYLTLWQGTEEIAGRIRTMLQTFAGTWLYDQSRGMHYLGQALEKPAEVGITLLRAEIFQKLQATLGVQQVQFVEITYANRAAQVTFECRTDAGALRERIELR